MRRLDTLKALRWPLVAAGLVGAFVLGVGAAPHIAIPASVRTLLNRFGNGGSVVSVRRENEDGLNVTTYVMDKAGRKMEIQLGPDGKLNATEEGVGVEQLPARVRATAGKVFPKGVIAAERAVTVIYEVKGRMASGRRHEVLITRPGVLLVEHEAPKNGAHEDRDND